MQDETTTRVELQVPLNSGYTIGNTLRQFAMRGSPTWQIAAYNFPVREGTFGFGEGNMFTYLDLLSGQLVCKDDSLEGTVVTRHFERSGDIYVSEGFEITGLEKLNAPRLEACLIKASGARTSSQNHSVAKQFFSESCECVPSRHTKTITFRFDVKPIDLSTELLIIDATPGSVETARNSAVSLLSGLQI